MRRHVPPFAASYFASVFAVAFALGVVRTLWLAPAIGPLSPDAALAAGASAFALLMLAELGVSMGLAGRTVAEHLALYARPEAALGLAGQLLFAATPWLRARNNRT